MDKIPEDVVYNIIFPFLNNQDGCNLIEPQIALVNKRVYSAKSQCRSMKLYFGGQRWCSVHTPHEYTLSKYMKQKLSLGEIRDRLMRLFTDISISPLTLSSDIINDKSLTYHDSNHLYTPNELLYYWNRVLEKTAYQVEHLCCGGNGVSISNCLDDENDENDY